MFFSFAFSSVTFSLPSVFSVVNSLCLMIFLVLC
jgi:hypothetical protein